MDLDPGGVEGDRWAPSGKKLDHDVSLMDVRMAGAIAERSDWALFCDCDFLWRADVAELAFTQKTCDAGKCNQVMQIYEWSGALGIRLL